MSAKQYTRLTVASGLEDDAAIGGVGQLPAVQPNVRCCLLCCAVPSSCHVCAAAPCTRSASRLLCILFCCLYNCYSDSHLTLMLNERHVVCARWAHDTLVARTPTSVPRLTRTNACSLACLFACLFVCSWETQMEAELRSRIEKGDREIAER